MTMLKIYKIGLDTMHGLIAIGMLCWIQVARGDSYRLPGDITPHHYDIRLLYDVDPLTNFSFYGIVDILVTVTAPTERIVLHAQDYSIAEDRVSVGGAEDPPAVSDVALNDTFNLLTLRLDRPLRPGQNYTLALPFSGNLRSDLLGVFISSYASKNSNAKEYLIATLFEPTSARKGFPCFDEPTYKASFGLVVGHHRSYSAVSNMPLLKTYDNNVLESYWPWDVVEESFKKSKSDFVWDQFENTVPMSTYLVAFVVSQLSYVESPAGLSTTKFRIWTRSIEQASYAATMGPKFLSYYEKWFNVSFPLPKQDMIAIPDYGVGGMENWGLITYMEVSLLYDKRQSSMIVQESVATIIAHELAHQWFGNLVTMKWWSDLWLKEGFATYAEAASVAAVEPAWDTDRYYLVTYMVDVFSFDALESSHPVSTPIDDPKRIFEIFDKISYRKGSLLIRMMATFLGDDVFKEAIHNYLVKYSYKNADQDDLWHELTQSSIKHNALTRDVTVKRVMDTWTTQTGYPLLTVQRDYSDNTFTITQERYLSLGVAVSSSAAWWVPLSVLCQKDSAELPAPLRWLADDEGLQTAHQFSHGAGKDDWLLFNPDMIAPYRVNYDARNWQLVSAALHSDHTTVPVLGRVQLLTDAFELAWSNRLDYTIALQLASYLEKEKEYLPLYTGLDALAKIETVLKRRPEYGAFQKYVGGLISGAYKRAWQLANENRDDIYSTRMQTLTSAWACRMQVPRCEDKAVDLLEEWMNATDPDDHMSNPVPPDLGFTVYCAALARGSVEHWQFLLARKQATKMAVNKIVMLRALGCTREVWLLHRISSKQRDETNFLAFHGFAVRVPGPSCGGERGLEWTPGLVCWDGDGYLEWTITDGSTVRRQDSFTVINSILTSNVGYYVGRDFVYNRIKDIHAAFHNQEHHVGVIKHMLEQFTTQRELDEFLEWREKNAQYLDAAKLAVEQGIETARGNIAWINNNALNIVDKLRAFSIAEPGRPLPSRRAFLPAPARARRSRAHAPHPLVLLPALCLFTTIA